MNGLAAQVVLGDPAFIRRLNALDQRPEAIAPDDEHEFAIADRRGDGCVRRRALQTDEQPLKVTVVIATAHHRDRRRCEEAAAPGHEAEGCDRQHQAGHQGQVAGFADPFVTFDEIVLHQAPPSPIRWKTLLFCVEPRL